MGIFKPNAGGRGFRAKSKALTPPIRTQHINYEHIHVASPHLAISDLRVFGNGEGEALRTPANFQARRDGNDPRNAFLTWEDVPSAVGSIILWGIQDDKPYQTHQVFANKRTALELRALTVDQNHSFAIEAFTEKASRNQANC